MDGLYITAAQHSAMPTAPLGDMGMFCYTLSNGDFFMPEDIAEGLGIPGDITTLDESLIAAPPVLPKWW